MRTVENSVNSMDDPDSLNEYLIELGRRHVMRSVKPSVNDVSMKRWKFNLKTSCSNLAETTTKDLNQL